jgi:ribosomal-protein-alanine N-acetyltransferase
MNYKIIATTPRIFITELAPCLADEVYRAALDASNREFLPDEVFETPAAARKAIEFLISRYSGEDGPFVYAVLLRPGEYVGHVEAVQIDHGWEVGYQVAEAYTGRGLATEALTAFIPYIMRRLGTDKLWGICRADNNASLRVLEKCGFELESEGEAVYHGKIHMIRRYVYRSPEASSASCGDVLPPER